MNLFILGIERSATTWIANILDSHSQLDVYMEPLSSFTTKFEDWPGRFTELENPKTYAEIFTSEFEQLKKNRRFFLTRASESATAWKLDLKLAQFLIVKQLAPDSVQNFYELNFHRKNRSTDFRKVEPTETVIKELRLNFNTSLLPLISPSPKVIVPIRDMTSCVHSMDSHIKDGNLIDLKKDLLSHYGKINPGILCHYWIDSYEAVISGLQNQQIPYQIISHTELLKNPLPEAKKMFDLLNLEMEEAVHRYLDLSDQEGEGIHKTTRNRQALLDRIESDRKQIFPLVEEEIGRIEAHPILKKFI